MLQPSGIVDEKQSSLEDNDDFDRDDVDTIKSESYDAPQIQVVIDTTGDPLRDSFGNNSLLSKSDGEFGQELL